MLSRTKKQNNINLHYIPKSASIYRSSKLYPFYCEWSQLGLNQFHTQKFRDDDDETGSAFFSSGSTLTHTQTQRYIILMYTLVGLAFTILLFSVILLVKKTKVFLSFIYNLYALDRRKGGVGLKRKKNNFFPKKDSDAFRAQMRPAWKNTASPPWFESTQ